jgi:CheY-like chemotaxis protein
VKIYLPRAHPDVVAAAGRGTATNAGTNGSTAGFVGGSDTILVVEDDSEVRVYVTGVLRGFGYNVIAVEDGPAVLSILPTIESLDLLFTDVVLPHGMDGKEVSAAVLDRFPDAAVIFTSGYTKNAIIHNGRLDGETWLIRDRNWGEPLGAYSTRGALAAGLPPWLYASPRARDASIYESRGQFSDPMRSSSGRLKTFKKPSDNSTTPRSRKRLTTRLT